MQGFFNLQACGVFTSTMSDGAYCINTTDVAAAAQRILGRVTKTPVLTCASLNAIASKEQGANLELFFKCENFQKTGSFKARGASNAVLSLPEAASAVCTHSSGNHAQALAWAAGLRGLTPHIVMPSNAPTSKVTAVKGYGGLVIVSESTQAAREVAAAQVERETGAVFIHPSENPWVIAGQGTLGLELLQQLPEITTFGTTIDRPVIDIVVVPVGGGGLISGVATAVKGQDPRIVVVGAEPATADDAVRSKAAGSIQTNLVPPDTIADGLKTTLGPNTWPIVRDKVDVIVPVTEGEIRTALRQLFTRLKVVLEPSAAVGLAVVLSPSFRPVLSSLPSPPTTDQPVRVAIVLCGGNLDLDKLAEYI